MKIAVFGLGKLGAPLAAVLASKGFDVGAYDHDPEAWKRPPPEPGLRGLIATHGHRIALCERPEDAVMGADASFVIVPTPSLKDGTFSNDYVLGAVADIGLALSGKGGRHVVNIVSTVMPGSCDGRIRELLEQKSGRRVGKSLGLTYSPEFIALGTVVRDLLNPDFIQIGESDREAGDLIEGIQRQVIGPDKPIYRMSLASAELAKIMNNAFICMKIGFANMLADICDKLPGADSHQVAQAIGADHRIGSACLRPGLGFGGPCLPRDTKAVEALAHSLGLNPAAVRAAGEANLRRAAHVVEQACEIAQGGKIAILGQSYKPGTPVTEASQGVKIAEWLNDAGREVATYDPMAACTAGSVEEAVYGAECVIIATPWEEFRDVRRYTDAPVIDPWGLLR